MIHVMADPDTCLARVKSRNRVDQLDVSDKKVSEYNKIAAAVTYDWDLEINNNSPASEVELLAAIQSIGTVGRER
jgi:hypothetical protein